MNLDEWHEQAGRAAYGAMMNRGKPFPTWEQISPGAREQWQNVARAVLAEGVIEVRPSPELAEQQTREENEALRKIALDATNDRAAAFEAAHAHLADYRSAQGQLDALRDALARGEASDGHHTHNELYTYRMLYNALAALAFKAVGWRTVKSWRHSDGELCFGSPDWFVVHVESPAGQITNHYKRHYWHHFAGIEEVGRAPEWDGHSPEVATLRLEASIEFLRQALGAPPMPEYTACTGCAYGCEACAGVFRPGGTAVPDNE